MTVMTKCVFCTRQAIAKNTKGLPTCVLHKKEEMPELKCICGEILSLKESRYGLFFLCPNCGPISLRKALSLNKVEPKTKVSPRIITITSEEADLM